MDKSGKSEVQWNSVSNKKYVRNSSTNAEDLKACMQIIRDKCDKSICLIFKDMSNATNENYRTLSSIDRTADNLITAAKAISRLLIQIVVTHDAVQCNAIDYIEVIDMLTL